LFVDSLCCCLCAGDAFTLFLSDLQQQQQQFWSMLEASLRVHGCLLQQQQKFALLEEAAASLVCLADKLPLMAEQQRPSQMLLSLLLSLCKLARVYALGDPRVALSLAGSVLKSCIGTLWPTASSNGSSISSSSNHVLPMCAVLARGLHCLGYALEQAADAANRCPELQRSSTVLLRLKHCNAAKLLKSNDSAD
jgi:hypothetical protein